MRSLLEYGANPNIKDDLGHISLDCVQSSEVCRMLLDASVDILSRNLTHSRSALHRFCARAHSTQIASSDIEVVDLLIEAGTDINVGDSDEETSLHRAISVGRIDLAKHLLDLGANPNTTNTSSRYNAMHIAVGYDRCAIIPVLLAKGADYTAIARSGRNIAHYAAISAGTQTVQLLAQANLVDLDFDLPDHVGKTPADHIAERVVLQESEEGIHEAFEAFVMSVPKGRIDLHRDSTVELTDLGNVEAQVRTLSDIRLPGAFPG